MQVVGLQRHFETFSYLPPLTTQQIAKQLQYVLSKGYVACIEFSATAAPTELLWTMWKLPLFGAQSAEEILAEIQLCKQAYPNFYVRVVAFDSYKQVQIMSFLVQKPSY